MLSMHRRTISKQQDHKVASIFFGEESNVASNIQIKKKVLNCSTSKSSYIIHQISFTTTNLKVHIPKEIFTLTVLYRKYIQHLAR